LNEFFATMGTIICIWYAPEFADRNGLVLTIAMGIFLNIASFIFSIIGVILDSHAEKSLKYESVP